MKLTIPEQVAIELQAVMEKKFNLFDYTMVKHYVGVMQYEALSKWMACHTPKEYGSLVFHGWEVEIS